MAEDCGGYKIKPPHYCEVTGVRKLHWSEKIAVVVAFIC
jgi:hypothetical protein